MTVPFPDTWADAWEDYEYAKESGGQSRKTISTRRTSVLRLAKAYPDRDPQSLTRRDLERHITLIRKTLAPQTVYGSFHDLRSFFGWLAEHMGRKPADSIMAGMTCKTPEVKLVPVLTAEQLKALIRTCKGDGFIDARDHAIITMLLETGMRRSELQNLKMSDVDLKACSAFIRRGKGGKARITIFGQVTSLALRRYIRVSKKMRQKKWDEDSPLFLSRTGDQLTYSGIGLMLTRRGEEAGIPHLHAHLMRHAWTHLNLENGLGESNIQTLAGWTSGRQLQRYGKALAVQRAVTAARANPVGRVLTRR